MTVTKPWAVEGSVHAGPFAVFSGTVEIVSPRRPVNDSIVAAAMVVASIGVTFETHEVAAWMPVRELARDDPP